MNTIREAFVAAYQERIQDPIKVDMILNRMLAHSGECFGQWGAFVKAWSNCKLCRLMHVKKTPVVCSGSLKPKLAVIGEAPGPQEDEVGVPFVGPTGTLLRTSLSRAGGGVNVDENVFFVNALTCIPKDTPNSSFRSPTEQEVRACMPRFKYIYESVMKNAKAILITGKFGYMTWKLMHDPEASFNALSRVTMKSILGWHEPEQDGHPMVYVTYHPSYVERQRTYSSRTEYMNIMQAWVKDLAAVNKFITDGEIRHVRSK